MPFFQEVAALWESCCDNPLWQAVFWATDLVNEIPANPAGQPFSGAGQAEPVGAELPPPERTPEKKKKKKNKKASPKSLTPEKPKSARRRRVPHVDNATPADFGQPRKIDPTLQAARKKRTVSQAFSMPIQEVKKVSAHPDDTLALEDSGSED